MPIYEFRCLKCGYIFELLKLKKSDADSSMKCPKCSSNEVERVLSTVSIGTSSGGKKAKQTIKSCSGGSCATFEIPGRK
ncbi:MAG: zinc ribbon domain-containing protein [Nitrospirota bacterium]